MNSQPARGMRDFLPADVRRREYVIGVIKEVYERYGFEPLETPAVENIETLMGKYGEEGNQLIFKILKRGVHEKTGEADLALRYDLTVPLARVVAQHKNDLPKFFKRYQIQPVWRADRPARGRFREFYQCDVDVLGSKSMVVEAELCAAASDVLITLGFTDFTIRFSHRHVLTRYLDTAGVNAEQHSDALIAIDKLRKIGIEGVKEEFASRGIPTNAADRILDLFSRIEDLKTSHHQKAVNLGFTSTIENNDWNFNIFQQLDISWARVEPDYLVLQQMKGLLTYVAETPAFGRVRLDPSFARGLSYYTGAIMEIDVEGIGSLGGGGRYDNLIGMFSGQEVPACGFSLGLERIIVVMTERNMFPADLTSAPADVMVTIWNEESVTDSIAMASELRQAGLRVDLYPETDKLGKQFKYASSRNIPFVVVIGAEEKERGEVALKDMRSGDQREVVRSKVTATILEALGKT